MLTWSDAVLLAALDAICSRSVADGWTLRLFVNDFQPASGSQPDDFTEASFVGYVALPVGAFSPAASDGEGAALAVAAGVLRFTKGTGGQPQRAFGLFITDQAGAVLFAERFPEPATFDSWGDFIDVQVQVSLTAGP